jgi:integrase
METVKYRSVTINIHPWKHPSGREYWRFKAGDKQITRATLDKAKDEARRHAVATYRGALDLEACTPAQIAAMKRMIEADPSCKIVDDYLVWLSRRSPRKNSREAVAEFLAEKQENRGLSHHNVATLKRHLAGIPDKMLCDIAANDLPALKGAARTRKNTRAAWVTFFKWCVEREYLPHGEKTVAERVGKPIVTRGIPATWTPDELRILLKNVSPKYLPWLALAAFAGVRTEEVCPERGSDKSPLAWEDIHWDRGVIIVRPETAKTKQRRVIPICVALRALLRHIAGTGPIGPHLPPSCPRCGGEEAETTRLGQLVGGWKRNALRHSFLSYRATIIGLAQTSMEAGNSESEARRSYNDAKTKDDGEAWFAVVP